MDVGDAAVIFDRCSLSWSALRASVALSALRLRTRSRAQLEVVASLLGNGPYALVAVHAVQRAGGVVCPLNPGYTKEEVEHHLQNAQATRVVVDDDAQREWSVPSDSVHDRRCWLIVVRTHAVASFLVRDHGASLPLDAIGMCLFTSGTTGKPKGVQLSDANLRQHAVNCLEVLPLETDDLVLLPGLPLFHIYAIAVWTVALDKGVPVHSLSRFALDRVAESRGTVMHMVPTMAILLQHASAVPPAVRRVVTGAAPLPLDVQRTLGAALRADILQGFGMSELAGVLAVTRTPLQGSIGTVAREVSVRTVDPEGGGTDAPEGGELRVRSAQVFSGYTGRDPTECFDADGYFCTGDLAVLRNGSLYIVGRLKEQIKVGGFLVGPQTVEEVVVAHPDVVDACAVGVPDAFTGEAIVVYFEGRDGVDLRAWSDVRLVEYKRPARFVRVPRVLRSAAGKLLRNAMLAQHPLPVQPDDDASGGEPCDVATLSAILRDATERDVPPDAPLMQRGVTSLEAVRFATEVARRCGVRHDPTLVFAHGTLRGIAHALSPSSSAVHDEGARHPSVTTTVAVDTTSVFAAAADALPSGKELTRLLRGGACACAPVADRFDVEDLPDAALLYDVTCFDASAFGVAPVEAATMDPQQRLLLTTARPCTRKDAPSGDAVVVAACATEWHAMAMAAPSKTAYAASAGTLSVLAGRLAFVFDLHGPTYTVDTACSASLVALAHAARECDAGGDDGALAAGVNLVLCTDFTRALAVAGMLSPRGRCHTFDARADGYARSEAVWTSRLSGRAGAAFTCADVTVRQDGLTASLTAPSGARQRALLAPACAPVVEAHGTGTALGDAVEVAALGHVVADSVVVGGAKGNLGHAEAAAGAYGMAKAMLQLAEVRVHPNAQLQSINPHFALAGMGVVLPTQTQPCVHEASGVSSFGYSGTIAHARFAHAAVAADTPSLLTGRATCLHASFFPLSAQDDQLARPTHARLRALRNASEHRLRKAVVAASDGPAGDLPRSARYDVIVIGAGMAGLTNACVAADAGCARVLVLEKTGVVGGTWAHYGNATSRVNSSEPAYRLYGSAGAKRNHTHLPDVLRAAAEALEARATTVEVRVRCCATAVRSGRVEGVAERSGRTFGVEGFVIACTNRRLGSPRTVTLPGEESFGGPILSGLRDSTAGVAFAGKTVVVYGMGAFSLENVRTALEGGAEQVHVVCRRTGTVCPQIMDYVNFAQRLDPVTWERDPRLSARLMAAWRALHVATGTPLPECWSDGLLKPDGHTVSVADAWFLAHHHERATLHVGSIAGIDRDGTLRLSTGTRLARADVLIKSTGFDLHRTSGVLPAERMHGLGVMAPELMVQVEAHLDDKFFHSPFGSSYLLQAEVNAHIFQHLRAHPDEARALLADDATLVAVDSLTAEQQYDGLKAVVARIPAARAIVDAHVHRSAVRCAAYMPMSEYVAYNARQWRLLDRMLARPGVTRSFAYPFDEFRTLEEEDEIEDHEAMTVARTAVASACTLVVPSDVLSLLREMLGDSGALDADSPVMEAGLDSIAVIEFRNILDARFGVALPATVLFDAPTARALARHLSGEDTTAPPPVTDALHNGASRGVHAHALVCAGGVRNTASLARALRTGAGLMADAAPWTLEEDDGVGSHASPACGHGGFASDTDLFDPAAFHIKSREAQSMDPQQRMLLTLVEEAPCATRNLPDDASVHVGAGYADFAMLVARGDIAMNTYTGPGGYLGVLSGRVSFCYGLHGPCVNVDTSCSSGLVAAHCAAATPASLAVCAAVFLMLLPWAHRQLARSGMLSPTGRCHTFDAAADGFARGEACAVCLLCPETDRTTTLASSVVRQDGRSASLTAPNGNAQRALLAVARSGTVAPPRHEAHGTGTALGDPIETGAYVDALESPSSCASTPRALMSVKANGGHAEPAAGLMGLCVALRAAIVRPCARLRRLNVHVDASLRRLVVLVTHVASAETCGGASSVASFGVNGTIAAAELQARPRSSCPAPPPTRAWRRRRFALSRDASKRVTAPPMTYAVVWHTADDAETALPPCRATALLLSDTGVPEAEVHRVLRAATNAVPPTVVVTCGTHACRWAHAGVGAALRSAAREGHAAPPCVDVPDWTVLDVARVLAGEPETRLVWDGGADAAAMQVPRLAPVAHGQEARRPAHGAAHHALFGGSGELGRVILGHVRRMAVGAPTARVRVHSRSTNGVDVSQAEHVRAACGDLATGAPVVAWMLAGTLRDGVAAKMTFEAVQHVYAPKVHGAAHVHAALAHAGATLVLFSSIAIVGSAGQANYAAANACLNALALWRKRSLALPAVAMCWGPWQGLGLARKAKDVERVGLRGIRVQEGLAMLESALICARRDLVVLVLAAYADRAETASYLAGWWTAERAPLVQRAPIEESATPHAVWKAVRAVVPDAAPGATLDACGVDSLALIELSAVFANDFGVSLMAETLAMAPNVGALVHLVTTAEGERKVSGDGATPSIQEEWNAVVVMHTADAFVTLAPHLANLKTWVRGSGGGGTSVRQRVDLGVGVQGYAGVLHGGVTGMLMDDTMGVLAACYGTDGVPTARSGVTASLEVHYERPCKTNGSTVELIAWYERIEGQKHFLACEMRDTEEGLLLASGRSLYVFPRA